MALPEPGERRAAVPELLDEAGHRGIRRVPGEGSAELQDDVVPARHEDWLNSGAAMDRGHFRTMMDALARCLMAQG